nr:hypothetical protein [Armatimonas sp.]
MHPGFFYASRRGGGACPARQKNQRIVLERLMARENGVYWRV